MTEGSSSVERINGEGPKILQECSEGDLDAMLAEQRPCHYAIANGHHVLWVPKHVPCSFEPSSGRLVVEVGHNSRWLAPLHNPRSPLLKVPVGPAVKIAPSRRWVPELRYPRKEPWRRAQVLELDFSKVDKSECCPLARVRVYSEELRSLREALQLMVQRGEGIGSGADGKGNDPSGDGGAKEPGMEPIAESATPETSIVTQQPAPSQQSSPVLPATPARLGESPLTGCACFPGLRRRHNSSAPGAAAQARGVLHIPPRASDELGVSEASVAPDTPQQKGRQSAAQTTATTAAVAGASAASNGDPEHSSERGSGSAAIGSSAGSAREAANSGEQGIEASGVPEHSLRRGSGSGTLSSVDEAADSFMAAAGTGDTAVDSAAEVAVREWGARSGDSVSSVAGPWKGYQPGAAKALAWGDSAQESPLSTAAVPSAATSHRGDYSQGSPHSTTAGLSTATPSQRGSGDSGRHIVFFGLEAAGPSYGQKVLLRPEFTSGSTTSASSRRPSGEVDGIWSSRDSSRGSNEALLERASNFKRSLEAAQHAFYHDISPEAAGSAAGIKIVAPATAVAAPTAASKPAAAPPSIVEQLPGGSRASNAATVVAKHVAPDVAATGDVAARLAAERPAAAEPEAAAGVRRPERRRRAEGRSLPELLLQTAQAIRSCPEFTEPRQRRTVVGGNAAARQTSALAEPEKAELASGGTGWLKVTHSDGSLTRYAGGDAAGVDIWDTARGPAGQYWDVPRAARSLEAGNRFVLQPDRGHAFGRVPIGLRAPQEPIAQAVRQQASLITQSKRSCGEVWAPGYESSPEGSSDEEESTTAVAPAAKRVAPSHQRIEEGSQRDTSAQSASQPSRAAAVAAPARPAVAESPFRPRPPKQAAAGGNTAGAAQPQPSNATSRLRPKRLFQSPPGDPPGDPPGGPPGGPLGVSPGGQPSANLATQPEPATPSPATPRTAVRDASSGASSEQPGMSTTSGRSAATTEFFSLPATPLLEFGSAKESVGHPASSEAAAAHDSKPPSSTPFQQASHSGAVEAAGVNASAATSEGAAAALAMTNGTHLQIVDEVTGAAAPSMESQQGPAVSGRGDSSGAWSSSGLHASSSLGNAVQTPSRGSDRVTRVDDAAEQLISVQLKVSKPRQPGFVAAAIAALGLSSPVVGRSPSQGEAVSLSLTPVPSPGAAREKLALSPDQFDMSWFTGRLSPANTGISANSGNSANTGVSASALGGDRVASAAARLLAAAPAASAQPEAAEPSPSPPPPGKIRAALESPPPEPAEESTVPDALTEQTEAFEGQPAAEDGSKVGEGKCRLSKLQSAQLSNLPNGGPSGESQEASSAGGSDRKAVALPGIYQKDPATAVTHKGPALPGEGSEIEGSPRPPGLLYKPELRSVAERVKYIERRSHNRNLDSPRTPRGMPSPRARAEAAGSHPPPLIASIQRQPSSALTSALRDSGSILPYPPNGGQAFA